MIRSTGQASYFENWVQTDVLPQATTYLASITSGVISMVKLLFNTIIGLIVSVYVLNEKKNLRSVKEDHICDL